MILTEIYAKNYKGFNELELKLNKVNLVIGRNGSGKSTICRLVPLIISSLVSNEQNAIDFSPLGIDLAGSFEDLSHTQSNFATITLGASFLIQGKVCSFKTEIIYSDQVNKIIVKRFDWFVDNQVKFTSILEDIEIDNLVYINSPNVNDIDYDGLLPSLESIRDENIELITDVINEAKKLKKQTTYLGPFRENLKRVFPSNLKSYDNVGPRGQYAPYILAEDGRTLDKPLHGKMAKWMKANFNGKYISSGEQTPHFSLLTNKNDKFVNIIDDGIGYSQIFPIIVSRLSESKKSKIEIVEQPELHLHPSACGAVTDLYLTAIEEPVTIILETHSKEVVLRLRRRVAESKDNEIIDNTSLIFTDVSDGNCFIQPINIDENGGVDWWPEGVFEESFEEILAINEAKNAN
ncbi:AAA family ATPase [Vibrio cyclitrophicus]